MLKTRPWSVDKQAVKPPLTLFALRSHCIRARILLLRLESRSEDERERQGCVGTRVGLELLEQWLEELMEASSRDERLNPR